VPTDRHVLKPYYEDLREEFVDLLDRTPSRFENTMLWDRAQKLYDQNQKREPEEAA
jgi:hypothetical protein